MNIIAAIDASNGIGKNNKLLAHIPEDLKYFKDKTKKNVVVMGYDTYMSLPKKPLQNRINIVLTSKKVELKKTIVVNSISELLSKCNHYEEKGLEVYICGGASLYKQMMPYVNKLFITQIMESFDADTFFPKIQKNQWKLISSKATYETLTYNPPYKFLIYNKINDII